MFSGYWTMQIYFLKLSNDVGKIWDLNWQQDFKNTIFNHSTCSQ